MADIELRGITKRFRQREVLHDLVLDVAGGEAVALVGRNGAGKSTLLRILATTLVADEGTGRVAGFDLRRQSAAIRRVVGVSFADERSWYLRLSAMKNLDYFGALHGMSRVTVRFRAGRLLDTFGLTDAAQTPVADFSSGMRARLGLARALLADPAVLLLDEPTRSIDIVGAAVFRDALAELRRTGETTVVFSTHDLGEALQLADRVVLVRGGGLVEQPSSVDVAELSAALEGQA